MNNYDVIIVGAGFAGITAAMKLNDQGTSFLLIEANDRIGGRVFTQRFDDGFYLDYGGQWIGPSQDKMYELVKKYNLEFYKTYNQGKNYIDLKNNPKTYRGLIPKTDIITLLNVDYALKKLQRMAKSIDKSNVEKSKDANELDHLSLEDFIRKNTITSRAYTIVKTGLETVFATDLSNVSLLHALFYIQSGTNLEVLLSIDNGAQQDRIVGGMQLLADKICSHFIQHIKLSTSLEMVNQSSGKVIVTTSQGEFTCKKLILAIPPYKIPEIKFNPPLSKDRMNIYEGLVTGKVAKCFGVYSTPFWREKGFSGQVLADESIPFQTIFDASPKDGSRGVLMGFCIADRHDDFFKKDIEYRKKMTLESFAKYFGSEAMTPLFYTDYTMKDNPYIGGCYAAIFPKGVRTEHNYLLSKPEGNIHFAGTETSDIWFGYIEGAVRSGERAVAELSI